MSTLLTRELMSNAFQNFRCYTVAVERDFVEVDEDCAMVHHAITQGDDGYRAKAVTVFACSSGPLNSEPVDSCSIALPLPYYQEDEFCAKRQLEACALKCSS